MKNRLLLIFLVIILGFISSCKKYNLDKNFCDCSESPATVVVDTTTLTIPNIITPNGDCHNDAWIIDNIEYFPDCKIKIYKNGIKKFESTGYTSDIWGGSVKDGKYKYVIEIGDKTITGYVCSYRGGLYEKYDVDDFDCLNECTPIDLGDPILTN